MVSTLLSLILLTGSTGDTDGLARLAYKPGYSVVMPRPFLKRPQRIGPAYVGANKDHLYIVSSAQLSTYESSELARAKGLGGQAVQRFLDAYGITFTMAGKTLRRESGAVRGLPCVRRIYELNSGERGALLAIFNGAQVYILVCVNPPGEVNLDAAQRFFESFKLEKSVKSDPDLIDPPNSDNNYPPADENTGTV